MKVKNPGLYGKKKSADAAGFSSAKSPAYSVVDCGDVEYMDYYEPCDLDFMELRSVGDKKA